ncbi:MAG: S-layer homology domain-containing protein [Thermoleophilia bacterium]|nr:S-layer homology domain-containing protein [Thermoleophilia bacterium]
MPGFTDISALTQEAKDAIALLYTLGITQGTTATTFSPYADVTRRDMASFMVRLPALGAPSDS